MTRGRVRGGMMMTMAKVKVEVKVEVRVHFKKRVNNAEQKMTKDQCCTQVWILKPVDTREDAGCHRPLQAMSVIVW